MKQVRHRYASTLLALYLPIAAAQTAFEGRPVATVSFEPAAQPLDRAEIEAILPIHTTQPYSAAAVRAAIERLYATGRYLDIQADASDAGAAGIALKFLTRPSWFIGHVSVETAASEPPGKTQMAGASGLTLGLPFDEADLPPAEENIRKLLVGNGFFTPAISHRLSYDAPTQQVAVTFVVDAGRRVRYNRPAISGETTVMTLNEADRATHWRRFLAPGYRGITLNRTRSGVDNLRLKFQNANRLEATVTLDSIDSDGTPHLTVQPGPVVEVTAAGVKLARGRLRQLVPVFEEHTVDPDLLNEGSANLRDYFQSRGYFEAKVEFERTEVRAGKTAIVYRIDPGPRHKLVQVGVSGNKYFDTKTIRERLYLVPTSFELRLGRYSEAFRRRDAAAIEDLYRSNGFRDVKVTSRTEDDYKGKDGDFAAFFTIEEGPQYRVSSLLIDGAPNVDLSRTIESLNSQADQVFSEFNIATDRETILARCGESGFAGATFEWDSKPGRDPYTVDVRFTVHEGERETVRDVIVTGIRTTRRDLVLAQLGLKPGDPLSPAAMAETQRKLYDLGIFAQVDMAVQNPDGEERRKFALFDVEEASRYSLTGGFGAEFARIGGNNAVTDLSNPGGAAGFSPRVSFDLSRLNFLGTGQSISFQGRLSTLQQRAAVSYFVPRLWGRRTLDAHFSIFYDDTHDVRTFESRRGEASAQLVQHLSKSLTAFYRFNYRDVGVSNLKIDPLLLPRLAQSVRVGVASFNLVQDRRDDPTDPHRGIYNTLDLGLASRVFGSQTSFGRVLGRNATYYRLGEKIVLARETQFGVLPAFSIPASADPSDPIPLPERFYGGGGSTQRAFPENQAGPRDLLTGFPLGGSALFFNNTELRFPLYGGNVNGVLFEDAGNVYSSLSRMSFRTDQKDAADFNYMVHAAGFGVRYKTPVGPLRFDLAYSINPPKYNGFPGSYSQLLQCSVDHTCQASLQQISHFQFFFSIGQAF